MAASFLSLSVFNSLASALRPHNPNILVFVVCEKLNDTRKKWSHEDILRHVFSTLVTSYFVYLGSFEKKYLASFHLHRSDTLYCS
jgi:hypothetical protein